MMFKKVLQGFDVSNIQSYLLNNPQIYGLRPERTQYQDSPHRESKDVWFRFCKEQPYSPDTIEWLPVSREVPDLIQLTYTLFALLQLSELGGILSSRLPSGKKIYPHVDGHWHAERYRKFFVPITQHNDAKFIFEGKAIEESLGDVWEFDNSYTHWVNNNSPNDRISLIICAR